MKNEGEEEQDSNIMEETGDTSSLYVKDFDGWHPKKKILHEITTIPYFHEREVWFCKMGCNIGYEQDGKGEEFLRPVVIIKKYNQYLFTGIPLTSKIKEFPFYFSVGNIDGRDAAAIISQARSLSSKRLVNKMDTMEIPVWSAMKKAASDYIFSD